MTCGPITRDMRDMLFRTASKRQCRLMKYNRYISLKSKMSLYINFMQHNINRW